MKSELVTVLFVTVVKEKIGPWHDNYLVLYPTVWHTGVSFRKQLRHFILFRQLKLFLSL